MLSATFSPKSRGKILGIFNMMMALGVMMGVVVGGYLSANCGGWRVPFFIFAIPGIIFGIVAFFIKDYKTVEKKNTADGRGFFKDIARLMKIPTLKYMFIGYGLQNFAIYTMMAWGPAVLMRAMHIGEDKAGMIAGLVVLVSLLSLPVGGILADTWYRKNIKARLLLPMIGSLISPLMVIIAMMALYFNMFAVAIIFCALSGISGLGTGAVNAASQDVVAPGMRGMSWGLAIFFMYLIGGWSPVMIGILSDMMGGGATGLEFAMMIGAAISTPAALCNWIASRHYASDFDKVKDYIIAAEK